MTCHPARRHGLCTLKLSLPMALSMAANFLLSFAKSAICGLMHRVTVANKDGGSYRSIGNSAACRAHRHIRVSVKTHAAAAAAKAAAPADAGWTLA